MCICIASPKNNPIPTDEILKTCFRNNSDGAGFAFNTDNHQVKIVKGFMDFESFITTLHEYDKKYNFFTRGLLIHMRIGTSGKRSKDGSWDPGCTHPFPISSKDKHLKKLDCTTNFAVIHNGIINLTAGTNSELSDTMLFIKTYLSRLSTNKNWLYNKNNIDLIYDLIDSKMSILDGNNGNIVFTKGFHRANDGNFYSNNSYKPSYYNLYDFNFYSSWYDDYIEPECIQEYPLMLLKYDECVIYDDTTTEEYEFGFHDIYPLYLTQDGDLFANYSDTIYSNKIPMENLTYLGHGCIVSKNSPLKKSEFRKDAIGYV